MSDIEDDNGTYKPVAFQKICTTFFNYVTSYGHPVSASDCLIHYMLFGEKKS